MDNKEIWRPVVGYEGLYEVSNLGRIRSLDKIGINVHRNGYKLIKGKVLKCTKCVNGYMKVNLYKKKQKKTHLIHRLVADAFIPNPNNYPVINHINEIKTDNRACNLEYCTMQYNNEYSGTTEKMINARKKAVIQLTLNGRFVAEFDSASEAGRKTGINHRNISSVCLNKYGYKSAGGYRWSYK